MSDQIIARVSQSLAKEQSLESLVRQLLEMLERQTYPLKHIRIVNTEQELWNFGVEERHPRVACAA